MNKISKFVYYLTHRPSVLAIIHLIRLSPLFPDRTYIRWMYRLNIGRWPDLDNPKTFTEKLQWLKLYNRKPEYTTMVDKYAVKQYVANTHCLLLEIFTNQGIGTAILSKGSEKFNK